MLHLVILATALMIGPANSEYGGELVTEYNLSFTDHDTCLQVRDELLAKHSDAVVLDDCIFVEQSK